jgi:hypothetical protein
MKTVEVYWKCWSNVNIIIKNVQYVKNILTQSTQESKPYWTKISRFSSASCRFSLTVYFYNRRICLCMQNRNSAARFCSSHSWSRWCQLCKKVTLTLELLHTVEPCKYSIPLASGFKRGFLCSLDEVHTTVSKHVRNTFLIFIIYLTLQKF